jgi:hypothetical protein
VSHGVTAAELRDLCERRVAEGMAYVVLVIPSFGRARWGNRRIWPNGPKGRWIGALERGRHLVDCKIEDVLRGLEKLGDKPIPQWPRRGAL